MTVKAVSQWQGAPLLWVSGCRLENVCHGMGQGLVPELLVRCSPHLTDEKEAVTMAEKRKITGYLAEDPRLVELEDGKRFAAFVMMENKRYFDGDEQAWKDAKPSRYEVTVDQEGLRDNLMASLESGQRVTVDGNYKPKAFTDNEGNQRVSNKLYAKDVSASFMHNSLGKGGVAPGREEEMKPQRAMPAEELGQRAAGTWGQAPDPYPQHTQQFANRGQAVHQQYTAPPSPSVAPDIGLSR